MKKQTKVLLVLMGLLVCVNTTMYARPKHGTAHRGVEKSLLTGWIKEVKSPRFDVDTKNPMATDVPPGMVEIQGGSFMIGQMDEFITAPRNSERRTLTVSSFYMDQYEVSNREWRIYEDWTTSVFGTYLPELVRATAPDSLVWRNPMAYNEPYELNYYRHEAYSNYPVVGVSWEQAMAYCQWRTDRVNEMRMVNFGKLAKLDYSVLNPNRYMSEMEIEMFLKSNPDHPEYEVYEKMPVQVRLDIAWEWGYEGEEQPTVDEYGKEHFPMVTMYRLPYEWVRDHFVFNTDKYLVDSRYQPDMGDDPQLDAYGNPRKVSRADGVLFIGFRLPTEAEWEYAAFAPQAGEDGIPREGRIYPWSGYHPRDISSEEQGKMMANFVRNKGDMSGAAGSNIDGYIITAPVDAFAPNDLGLYNMSGNVNEWVLDVYSESSYEAMSEYNPYRGTIYSHPKRNEKNQLMLSATGNIEVEFGREDDKRNFHDGDASTRLDTDYPLDAAERIAAVEAGLSTEDVSNLKVDPTDVLVPSVSRNTRIYKGGSWNDRIYWLNPTTRRAMDQFKGSCTIGFRCAMTKVGDAMLVNTKKGKK